MNHLISVCIMTAYFERSFWKLSSSFFLSVCPSYSSVIVSSGFYWLCMNYIFCLEVYRRLLIHLDAGQMLGGSPLPHHWAGLWKYMCMHTVITFTVHYWFALCFLTEKLPLVVLRACFCHVLKVPVSHVCVLCHNMQHLAWQCHIWHKWTF